MPSVLMQAKELGAVISSQSLCMPAHTLEQFLNIATRAGHQIRYYECLYFFTDIEATEPSMELSRDFIPGESVDAFIALAGELASIAVERGTKRNIRPYFEVGLEPDLDVSGADIPVRR